MDHPEPWPLRHLALRTPRLELRPDDDAHSGAFVDNAASRRVSERLGYRANGSNWFARRGQPAEEVRLVLTPEDFARPEWKLQVEGLAACLPLLGADE